MQAFLENNFFGLDVSDRALRLVQLKAHGRLYRLTAYNEVAVPPETIAQGQVRDPERFRQLLQQLLRTVHGRRITARNVITVLPETITFIQLLSVPDQEPANVASLIRAEVEKQIPLELDEIYLDWQLVDHLRGAWRVLAGAAPKSVVDAYYSLLCSCGLTPFVMEIEAAAITRALLPPKDPGAKVIIDFGAVRTGLIVYAQGTIQFSISLPISGLAITQTIAQTLQLSLEEAEQAKVICGLDQVKCSGALRKILTSAIDQLARHINQSLVFYAKQFPTTPPVSELLLCGGGANLIAVDTLLEQRLKLPVRLGNPLRNITHTRHLILPQSKALSFTTALGLAIRGLQEPPLL